MIVDDADEFPGVRQRDREHQQLYRHAGREGGHAAHAIARTGEHVEAQHGHVLRFPEGPFEIGHEEWSDGGDGEVLAVEARLIRVRNLVQQFPQTRAHFAAGARVQCRIG